MKKKNALEKKARKIALKWTSALMGCVVILEIIVALLISKVDKLGSATMEIWLAVLISDIVAIIFTYFYMKYEVSKELKTRNEDEEKSDS